MLDRRMLLCGESEQRFEYTPIADWPCSFLLCLMGCGVASMVRCANTTSFVDFVGWFVMFPRVRRVATKVFYRGLVWLDCDDAYDATCARNMHVQRRTFFQHGP